MSRGPGHCIERGLAFFRPRAFNFLSGLTRGLPVCFGLCSISSDPALYFAWARLSCCAPALVRSAISVVALLVYLGVAVEFQWPRSAVAHCVVRQNLISVHSDFQRALAPCAASECHLPCVHVRSRAPRSHFTAGLFRLALRTARDVLFGFTHRARRSRVRRRPAGRVSSLLPSAISADGGDTQHWLTRGEPVVRQSFMHQSSLNGL